MMYNIRRINPYKFDTNVEDNNSENISDSVNIWLTSYVIMSWY